MAQENSFDSIKAVKRHGAKGFEVDVFLTADNQLVCFHDQNTYVSIKNSGTEVLHSSSRTNEVHVFYKKVVYKTVGVAPGIFRRRY